MPGFNSNSGSDPESIMYADNASFDGTERSGVLSTDGQLWMGAAAGQSVRLGDIVGANGVSVVFSEPSATTGKLTISLDGGGVGSLLGGPGITLTVAGGITTINSVVYTDQTATTLAVDSGTWATAAGAYVLPASPTEGELIEIVCITTGIIVTANTGQEIQLGGDVTSTAGTATNSSKGDSLVLRYRSTDTAWYSTSTQGVWTLA